MREVGSGLPAPFTADVQSSGDGDVSQLPKVPSLHRRSSLSRANIFFIFSYQLLNFPSPPAPARFDDDDGLARSGVGLVFFKPRPSLAACSTSRTAGASTGREAPRAPSNDQVHRRPSRPSPSLEEITCVQGHKPHVAPPITTFLPRTLPSDYPQLFACRFASHHTTRVNLVSLPGQVHLSVCSLEANFDSLPVVHLHYLVITKCHIQARCFYNVHGLAKHSALPRRLQRPCAESLPFFPPRPTRNLGTALREPCAWLLPTSTAQGFVL
jgi:hypothetical protein